MGNLVLSRQEGQAVRLTHSFWSPITVEVVRVTGGDCHLVVSQGGREMFIKAKLWESIPVFAPEVHLVLTGLAKGKAKLGFDAPLTVTILRTELENNND